LTYFTIHDPDEPIQIKDAKGKLCNFCVGADLNSDEEEAIEEAEEQTIRRIDSADIPSAFKEKNPGFFKRAAFWICGIESGYKPLTIADNILKIKNDNIFEQD